MIFFLIINKYAKRNTLLKCICKIAVLMYFVYVNWYLFCAYLECDAGKFGPRCEKVCPYPYYGNLCLFKCDCNENLCNPSDGCSGKWINKYYIADFLLKRFGGFQSFVKLVSINNVIRHLCASICAHYRQDKYFNNLFTEAPNAKFIII